MAADSITLHRHSDSPSDLLRDRENMLFALVEKLQKDSASGDELRMLIHQAREILESKRAVGNDGID